MRNLFLKPSRNADGAMMLVRDPTDWKPLQEAGEWKPETPYWINRVRDHDVIDATSEKLAEPALSAPAAPPAEPETPAA